MPACGPIYQSNIKLAAPGTSEVDHFVQCSSLSRKRLGRSSKDPAYENSTLNIPRPNPERCFRVEKGGLGWEDGVDGKRALF